MTVEIFRAVTPYVTFFLALAVGIMGFFLKFMITQNQRHFEELAKKIENLEEDIKAVDKVHQEDQRAVLENYVHKESFYMAIGKLDAVVSKIFDELKEVSARLNQTIGAINARKNNG